MSFSSRRLMALLAACLLLAGCPMSGPGTRLDEVEKLPDEFGVVALQISINAHGLGGVLENWDTVVVASLGDDQRYFVEATDLGLLNSSRVYVGALPPGEYYLFGLSSMLKLGDSIYTARARLPPHLGSFRVEIDRVTSLGALVYQPIRRQADDKGPGFLVSRYDDMLDLSHYIADTYPEIFRQLDHYILMGWEPDDSAEVHAEVNELIRRHALGFDHFLLDDGEMVMTGAIGQIYRREEGVPSWHRIDTGFNVQIGALARIPDGYLAGGERGLLAFAPALEGPWIEIPGPGIREAISAIHPFPNGNYLIVTRHANTGIAYLVDAEFSNWQELHRFDPQRQWLGGELRLGNSIFSAALAADRVVVFGNGERVEFNQQGEILAAENNRRLLRFGRQPDGIIVATPVSAMDRVRWRPMYSINDGRTWRRVPRVRDVESWGWYGSLLTAIIGEDYLVVSRRGYRNEMTRRIDFEERPRIRSASGSARVGYWGEQLERGCVHLIPPNCCINPARFDPTRPAPVRRECATTHPESPDWRSWSA